MTSTVSAEVCEIILALIRQGQSETVIASTIKRRNLNVDDGILYRTIGKLKRNDHKHGRRKERVHQRAELAKQVLLVAAPALRDPNYWALVNQTFKNDGGCRTCSKYLYAQQDECCLDSSPRISDAVPQLAVVTLPQALQINRDDKGRFVVSKAAIESRTVFGPLIAELQARRPGYSARFSVGSDVSGWLDCSLQSDEKCNWMKFVRMARNAEEQNLTAFQFREQIYFAAVKDIPAGEELRFHYAWNYGVELGKELFPSVDGKMELQKMEVEVLPDVFDELCQDEISDVSVQNHDLGADSVKETEAQVDDDYADQPEVNSWIACLFCSSKFFGWKKMRKHYRTHSVDGVYQCTQCDRAYSGDTRSNFESMKNHLSSHRPRVPSPEITEKVSSKKRSRKELPEKTSCIVESSGSSVGAELQVESQSPQRGIREPETSVTEPTKNEPSANRCIFCPKSFHSAAHLRKHFLKHLVNGRFKCPKCSANFSSVNIVEYHLRLHHPHRGKQLSSCSVCGLEYPMDRLLEHMKTHTHIVPAEIVQCDICNVRFRNMAYLRVHQKFLHNIESW